MKLTRDLRIPRARNLFFIKLFCIFLLPFFWAQAAFAADWAGSLPSQNIDISGDSSLYDVDIDMVKFGEDFYSFKDPDIGGGSQFYYYNLNDQSEKVGVHDSNEDAFNYWVEVKSDDGTNIRLMYFRSEAGDKLTGFAASKGGVYREFYVQSLEKSVVAGGIEFEDEFGDSQTGGGLSKYYKGTIEHDQMVGQIQGLLGPRFTVNGESRTLKERADIEVEKVEFNKDWSENLSEIARKNFTEAEVRELYTALLNKNAGLSVSPRQQELIDKFSKLQGVATASNGKITSTSRANTINQANSSANQAAQQRARASTSAGQQAENGGLCLYDKFSIDIENCVEQFMYMILAMIAWILGFSVWIFDMVFSLTVVNMSNFINRIDAIRVVWKVFRDFSNIVFIFILLYLAISTIIGINHHGIKTTLRNLVIVAILINFSMFFSKAVIDSSNILAISFYKKISPEGKSADLAGLAGITYDQYKQNGKGGIAGAFMGSFNLQRIFDDNTAVSGEVAFAQRPDAMTVFFMGSITMFIVFCIFIAGTIILIKRLTTLLVLIMTSSIAFTGFLLHKAEGMAAGWWNKLLKEAFYAPIFVACIWMALLIMTDPKFAGIFEVKNTEGWFNVSTVVNYIIVINFFLLALVAGEHLGASGASGAMKLYKGLKTQIGGRALQAGYRNTVGRVGFNLLEAKQGTFAHKFQNWRMRAVNGDAGLFGMNNWVSKKLAQSIAPVFDKAFHGMAHGKIAGAGNSFEDEVKERKDNLARYRAENKQNPGAFARLLLEQTVKGQVNVLEKQVADSAWDDVKDIKEKANLLMYMQEIMAAESNSEEKEKMADAIKRLRDDRPTGEESDKIKRAMEAEHLQYNANRVASIFRTVDDHGNETYNHEKQKSRIDALTANTNRTAEEETELQRLQREYTERKVQARQFVSGLTTEQKMGLRKEHLTHEDLADLFSGNDLEQLQRKNILGDQGYKMYAGVINKQVSRLENYKNAVETGDTAAMTAFKQSVKDHAASLGQNLADDEEEILSYYEENLLGRDKTTARSGNLGKFFPASKIKMGEGIANGIDAWGGDNATHGRTSRSQQTTAQAAQAAQQARANAAQARRDAAQQQANTNQQQTAQDSFNNWTT